MKIKITLILACFFSSICLSQTYRLVVKNNTDVIENCIDTPNTDHSIYIRDIDGNTLYSGSINRSVYEPYIFEFTARPALIRTNYSCYTTQSTTEFYNFEQTINQSGDCVYEGSNEIELLLTVPLKTLNQPIETICEAFDLQAHNACDEYLEYNWKYSTDGLNFIDIDAMTFGNEIYDNLSLSDLSLSGYTGYLYIKADIRYNFDLQDSNYPAQFIDETNIIIYTVVKCSPEIDDVTTDDTSCSYTNDGSFTVTFDRPLDSGENLNNLSLHWAGLDNTLNTADDVPAYYQIPPTSYRGTSFTWPNSIQAGTYRLLYQSDGANSAESFEPIIIKSPAPIVFTAIKNDVVCFNENNGKIIITVDPNDEDYIGTPPYSYSLNGALPPVPFSGNTHTITGLPPGDYAVKVFDSNDCTEQK